MELHKKRLVFVTLLMVAVIIIPYSLKAQKKELRIIADTSGAWFLEGKMLAGVQCIYANDRSRRTPGYLNGNLPWSKISLTSAQAAIRKGVIALDMKKVRENGGRLSLVAVLKNEPETKTTLDIRVPALKRLELIFPQSQQLIAGSVFTPELFFEFSNGIRYTCNPWAKDALIKPDEVTLYLGKEKCSDGIIKIPEDVIGSGQMPLVTAVWNNNQQVFDMKYVPIGFGEIEYLMFNEPAGANGADGVEGKQEQDGEPGKPGSDGLNARNLTLYMWLDRDSSVIRLVSLYEGMVNNFSLKTARQALEISLRGGQGGNGGKGGEGGNSYDEDTTTKGVGGRGGDGGKGGNGGSILIYCEPEAENYLPQLRIDNSGGWGGDGGQGGKGGKVYADGYSPLDNLLFPVRKNSGYDGMPGADGAPGPEAVIQLMPEESLRAMVGALPK